MEWYRTFDIDHGQITKTEFFVMTLTPGETVFAVNSAGRVFSLGKNDNKWRELEYIGLEFKRVSAAR